MSTNAATNSLDRITNEVEFLRLALKSMATQSYDDPGAVPLAAEGMLQALGRISDELVAIELSLGLD